MFTQKHYIALAEVIHQRRVKIRTGPEIAKGIQLEAVADLTKDMMDMFKRDNVKFDNLKFIGASSADLA